MMKQSIYKSLSIDESESLFSEFLIDSWSYSRLAQFSRNEKAFEMIYIYRCDSKSSSTTIAGQAYHFALENFFAARKNNNNLDIVDLENIAFSYIEGVEVNKWKLQKTTPSVDDCKQKAMQVTTSLLRNFYSELHTYFEDIEEIIGVEISGEEFLVINGVDIPLPCKFKIDLVVKTKSGNIAIVDHKAKQSFTSEEDLTLGIGTQAITYVNAYESKTGQEVNEIWFIENKYSQNRDKSPQLNCFKIKLDKDVRALYEALLYEPLRRMISAVSDPDYIFLINDSDNFVDKAELYDFWCRTNTLEVEDFNVAESKKEIISRRLKKIKDSSIATINPKVIMEFRKNASTFIQYDLSNKNMTKEEKIEHVLRGFGTIVRVAHKFEGYSSSTFLLEVSAGIKISSIQSRNLDIANAIDVTNVRIGKNLLIHEGKSYVSVEFAKQREQDLIFDKSQVNGLKIPIGKDNYGQTIYVDMDNHSTPHSLVCGATGSGKTEFLISYIEYMKLAGIKDITILDTKQEFKRKNITNVKLLCDIEEIEEEMRNLVIEMNERAKNGYDAKKVIIFDEFADALANSKTGKELDQYDMVEVGNYKDGRIKYERVKIGVYKSLEENLRILLQKGRSLGFRITAATQRASTKIITGDAKANFPVQICFRVPKEIDSRVVLDEAGAESLTGRGDGLIKSPEYLDVVRFQSYYKPISVPKKEAELQSA